MSLDWLKENPFAHRGLHNKRIPENSLKSFNEAIDKGFGIELDVQMTSDGEIIVFHDEYLNKLTGGKGVVNEVTLEYIKSLNILHSGEVIPTLKEVLDLVQGKVSILIEIKNKKNNRNMEKKVNSVLADYEGQYAIMSFNPFSLLRYKRINSNVTRGQILGEKDIPNFKKNLYYFFINILIKPDFIAYDVRSLPSWDVKCWKKRGLPILTWTVNSKGRKATSTKYADNIIFEDINK